MLPKIRPAMGSGPARPSIRPVKPSPLPPRPAPPTRKRVESGLSAKEPMREPYGSQGDGATMFGAASEPPTQANPRQRAELVAMSFEDETQARPVDDHLLAKTRDHVAPIDAPYESLPSLEVRRPFDSYDAEFAERDPGSQRAAAAHDQRRAPHHDEASYEDRPRRQLGSGARARPVASPWDEPQQQDHGWQREASGPQPHAWESPETLIPHTVIPHAPRVPQDVRPVTQPPFVVGVQPLRQPQTYPVAVPAAMHSPLPQPMPTHAHSQHPQHPQSGAPAYAEPMARTHAMMQQATGPAMHRASQQPYPAPAPSSTRVEAQESSKGGRFVWFVFGAAFGIAFAFFATGFPRVSKDKDPESLFPAPAALPAAAAAPAATTPAVTTPSAPAPQAPAPTTPPVSAAPAATAPAAPATAVTPVPSPPAPVAAPPPPIVAAPPPTMTVASPTALPQAAPPPAAAPAVAAQPAVAAPAPRPAAAPAPAPPPRRPVTTTRRASSEPSAPKPLLPGGGTEAPPSSAPDVNDILSGALRP